MKARNRLEVEIGILLTVEITGLSKRATIAGVKRNLI